MIAVPIEMHWNFYVVFLSYVLSVLGSWTTLVVIDHACLTRGAEQLLSIAIASISLGACGIWSMHFVGMVAMSIDAPIRYSVAWTVLSAIVSVVFCFLGVYRTVFLTQARFNTSAGASVAGERVLRTLLTAGVWTGFGVAAMHYLGMRSMILPSGIEMTFNLAVVVVSVLIAIGAASAAFVISHYSNQLLERILSALVMARQCVECTTRRCLPVRFRNASLRMRVHHH